MTNFEITFNLFQNLNKFEQKEIIKQFLDKMYEENVNESLHKYVTNSCDKIFEQASNIEPNISEKICTNFFDAVDEANAVIHTNSVEEIEELHKLFFNSIPNGTTFHQDGLTENDLKYANELGFEIDKYIITFGHISFFEREDYNIISFKDLKKLLKFE